MITDKEIRLLGDSVKDYTINCRRIIHEFAEVGLQEFKTSAFIRKELENMGLEIIEVGKTGLIGILNTGRDGAHIALRADIDALPITETEENLCSKRTCISKNVGNSHACGHDAHAAMLLGAMKVLSQNKDKFTGTIYGCFEAAEEIGGGILDMLKALEKFPIEACWGIHVYSNLEAGKICVDSGIRMAGASTIDIEIQGKGGHGSRPDLAANPVFCAASILNNLATAWVNQINPSETVTLGITEIKSEGSYNVIPETAKICGTLRFFSEKSGKKAIEILKKVSMATAEMENCKAICSELVDRIASPVINDEILSSKIKNRLKCVLDKNQVVSCEPWCATEPFARYCKIYPSVFAHLGIRNETYGSGAPHHNPSFDVDENVLHIGVMSTITYVTEVQRKLVS